VVSKQHISRLLSRISTVCDVTRPNRELHFQNYIFHLLLLRWATCQKDHLKPPSNAKPKSTSIVFFFSGEAGWPRFLVMKPHWAVHQHSKHNMLLTTYACLFNKEDLIKATFWKLLSHESSHLLVVLDLVLKNDSVGSLGLLPCQRHSMSSDVLGLDGGNWRGSWNKRKSQREKA